MAVFASGTAGVIGSKLSDDVTGLSYRDFLENGERSLPDFSPDDDYIHMAGIVGAQAVRSDLRSSEWVNVQSLPEFLATLRRKGLRRFVYVSSSHVYAPTREILTESSAIGPFSQYGMQKLKAENLLASLAPSLGINLRILRVFSILGPGMPPASLYGAAIRAADGHDTLRFALDIRDFMTPKECARLIERAACLPVAYPEVEILNLCSGEGRTVREAVSKLMAQEGKTIKDFQMDLSNSDVPSILGDPSKLWSRLHGVERQSD